MRGPLVDGTRIGRLGQYTRRLCRLRPMPALLFLEFSGLRDLFPADFPDGQQVLHDEALEIPEEERQRRAEAASSAGVSVHAADTRAIDEKAAAFGAGVDYIYEQPAMEMFNSLLPKYVAVQVFRALLESVAAEHAARMTAMDAATNNASEMIDSLTLAMNRARQAKITKEIIEIVSGAAAL